MDGATRWKNGQTPNRVRSIDDATERTGCRRQAGGAREWCVDGGAAMSSAGRAKSSSPTDPTI